MVYRCGEKPITPIAERDMAKAIKVFSDPFYQNGPNDQGIGWNIYASLKRVALVLVWQRWLAFPWAFDRSLSILSWHVQPYHQLAQTGLPTRVVANRLVGIQGSPSSGDLVDLHLFDLADDDQYRDWCAAHSQDYLNVAKVLDLSAWRVPTRIYIPSVLPYMLTGVRLAIGTAWLVIVAAEMLTGGVGIGFWVWMKWNNLNVPHLDRDRRHRFGRFDTRANFDCRRTGFYLRRVSR